jgi:pentatricopeptide repeat protein
MSICAVAQRPKEAVSVLDRMGKAGWLALFFFFFLVGGSRVLC